MKNKVLNIMNIMDSIEYGWVDKHYIQHIDDYDEFADNYILQSPDELLENKLGVCWDQVELERNLFKKNDIDVKTFFIVYYDDKDVPTHTFLTYEEDGKYYWFEHSWKVFKGIHEYDSLENLLLDVRNKFINVELKNNCDDDNLEIFEYCKPNYHLSVQEFYMHCEKGELIDVNK